MSYCVKFKVVLCLYWVVCFCFMIVVCVFLWFGWVVSMLMLGLSGCITSTSSLHLTSIHHSTILLHLHTSLHTTSTQLHSFSTSLTHSLWSAIEEQYSVTLLFFSCAIETTWEGRAILTFIPSQAQQHLTLTFKSWCLCSTSGVPTVADSCFFFLSFWSSVCFYFLVVQDKPRVGFSLVVQEYQVVDFNLGGSRHTRSGVLGKWWRVEVELLDSEVVQDIT